MWVGAIGGLFCFLPTLLSPLRNARELPKGPDDGRSGGGGSPDGPPVPGSPTMLAPDADREVPVDVA